LNNHLKQAATDIISILSNLPKSTVPSLLAGEDTATAIYEIVKLLKRVDPIPDFNSSKYSIDASAPRVLKNKPAQHLQISEYNSHKIPYSDNEIEDYEINNEPSIITTPTLQTHSNLPKNLRFNNTS